MSNIIIILFELVLIIFGLEVLGLILSKIFNYICYYIYKKERKRIARNMKAMGMSAEQIMQITGLKEKDIEKL